MLSFSRILRTKILPRQITSVLNKATYTTERSPSEPEEIQIPDRIDRSPTDILYALSATVGTDTTAAHYKYHDDPYLIPMSNIGKRTFALAQESGRKAARWIMQENRKLFQHSVADPPIKAFTPKLVFNEESEVDEDCLQSLIRDAEVTDAIFVHNLMVSKGMSIPEDLKQSLLELVCFCNHEDTLAEEYIEERWFKQGTTGKERQRKTWKDNELAEQLFNEIEPKNSKSYAAIIRGMCKYFQVERAWALFQEANEKGIELDTETYNALISVTNFLKESGDLRWELCQQLLAQMKERNLQPNIGTLNAVMNTLSSIGNYRLARTAALRVLSEFKQIGIEPSLSTWYYVLIIFCRERGPVSHVLVDILNYLGEKEFKIQNPKDTFFFVTAMDVCRNHLQDKNLAIRVDKLLHYGNNYDLIGDSFKESIYYRNYFGVLCQTATLEEFMSMYDRLVPNIYIPEPGIMEEILKTIDINGALELIPRMWSDMIIFDHVNREGLINRILNIMVSNPPNVDIEAHRGLDERFAIIAWDIFTRIQSKTEDRNQKLNFTGQMLGDILILLVRDDKFDQSNEVFDKLNKNQHAIPGTPSQISLTGFAELCIKNKRPSRCMACLQYCAEAGFQNSSDIAKNMVQAFTLDETYLSKIRSLVGNECLKTEAQSL